MPASFIKCILRNVPGLPYVKEEVAMAMNNVRICAGADEGAVFAFFNRNGIVLDDSKEYVIFPGLCDVHVHFREPGFSYKETIKGGSMCAAAGGYTAVCTMPNLNPVPDNINKLQLQLDIIERDACIKVIPYGSISCGEQGLELSEMAAMAGSVVGFSDDGKGVQDDALMEKAMLEAKGLGKMIVAHCEDNSLLNGGYIHDGIYAREHGHRGISSESEYKQLERDIDLVRKTGCAYHACHLSTKESVELVRKAKAEGLDISCETAPHYLLLCDEDLQEDGRFKMNPPLRSREDMLAMRRAVLDGTVDMIATDHAPHSAEEKGRGLEKSAMGIVGLESAFAAMYTGFVKPGTMSWDRLLELMCTSPRKRFGIPAGNDFTVFEISEKYRLEPESFQGKGRATPFAGAEFYGKCVLTVHNNKAVWNRL